jgi:hypothetical protein
MKLFQLPMKLSTAIAKSAGFTSGNMICQKIWNVFAPSIRAASSISLGRVRKNWRRRKI